MWLSLLLLNYSKSNLNAKNCYYFGLILLDYDELISEISLLQTVFAQFNPYIYGQNNTPNVESSVLRFEVNDCSSSRKKRSTSNSTNSNSIPGNVTMTLSSKTLPDMTYQNITPNGTLGMIYHTFTVPDSPKSIEISLKPVKENETYDLYIRKLLRADLTKFDIKVTLPRNGSGLTENETFSYLIPARNVTPGLLYVGVKKTPGNFSFP